MAWKASEAFRQAFKDAFSSPAVESSQADALSFDLTMLSDALAGPMYNVLTQGDIDYVFEDRERRFPGVIDDDTFRGWAMSIARSYQDAVAQFEPSTPTEKRDLAILERKAGAMMRVIDAAEVERRRP